MVELYTGLSSFYEIFNPWEMNLNIVSLHLPLLNFSETYRSPVCVHGRTFLSVILHARGQLPVHRTVLPCLSITFHESYFLFLYLYYSMEFVFVKSFWKNFFEKIFRQRRLSARTSI